MPVFRLSTNPFFFFLLLLVLAVSHGCSTKTLTTFNSKEGILLVAFGTSIPGATGAYRSIDAAYREAFPSCPVEWAFTSAIIRKKLAERGEKNASIGEALETLAKDGVKTVRVQSLHIMAGEEFYELFRALLYFIHKHPESFQAVYLGLPLLESRKDASETVSALRDSLGHECKDSEAVVLMAHGQEAGRAGLVLEGTRSVFQDNDRHFFMASVEGERNFEELLRELEKRGIKKIRLAPFMLVAGDHARNDLAGDEDDSWASQLEKKGYRVEKDLSGLGERGGVADIFIRHTREATENLVSLPKKL